jgi:hypothetical protein
MAHKRRVGVHALCYIVVIQTDAGLDLDIGFAAIETVAVLCVALDVANDYALRDFGLQYTDTLLSEKMVYALFALLGGDRNHVLSDEIASDGDNGGDEHEEDGRRRRHACAE